MKTITHRNTLRFNDTELKLLHSLVSDHINSLTTYDPKTTIHKYKALLDRIENPYIANKRTCCHENKANAQW